MPKGHPLPIPWCQKSSPEHDDLAPWPRSLSVLAHFFHPLMQLSAISFQLIHVFMLRLSHMQHRRAHCGCPQMGSNEEQQQPRMVQEDPWVQGLGCGMCLGLDPALRFPRLLQLFPGAREAAGDTVALAPPSASLLSPTASVVLHPQLAPIIPPPASTGSTPAREAALIPPGKEGQQFPRFASLLPPHLLRRAPGGDDCPRGLLLQKTPSGGLGGGTHPSAPPPARLLNPPLGSGFNPRSHRVRAALPWALD